MALRRAAVLVLILIAGVAGWFWQPGGTALAAEDLRRDLTRYRVEALPDPLPASWEAELARALRGAPTLSIVEPATRERVRELLFGVSWIDPRTVRVEPDVPVGLRVRFRPYVPLLRAIRQGELVALVGRDGVCLEPGFAPGELDLVPWIQLSSRAPVPVPGRKFSDPAVQEALRALPEFFALDEVLRTRFEMRLERIEISPDFPVEASVPPPLMFVTADERRIVWGRSAASRDPLESTLKITVEEKARRLSAVLSLYPRLRGLGLVRVDYPNLHLYDEAGDRLPTPVGIR